MNTYTNNIKSMTGYGKGEVLCEGRKITVEIKSLNSKQLDLSVKLPSFFRDKEFSIREAVSKVLKRGKVDVFVSMETVDKSQSTLFNKDIFEVYFNQINDMAAGLGINANDTNVITAIMRMPDVIQSDKIEIDDTQVQSLGQAVSLALEQIDNFRTQEGNTLIKDILYRIDRIEQLKNDIIPYDVERIESVRCKIYDSLESLNIEIDKNRFEQELIYYIERLDITEEKVRLQNHLDYFREVCANDEAPGRKIGFIAQEIGREINTTGSKANKSEMQRIVVEMKDELEKIKEQSLNIL